MASDRRGPVLANPWNSLALAILMLGVSCAMSDSQTPSTAPAQMTAPPLTFEDAIAFDNGLIRLAVSPRVGRVVDFGFRDQPNLLWINTTDALKNPVKAHGRTYANHGGDKLWPLIHPLWDRAYGGLWPPDGVLDGKPWSVLNQGPWHVTLQSEESPALGVILQRRIEVAPDQPVVRIRNTIRRVTANPFPVTAWQVTQIPLPDLILLDIDPHRPRPDLSFTHFAEPRRYAREDLHTLDDTALLWRPTNLHALKLGTLGSWHASRAGSTLFIQTSHFDPAASYPDLSSVQAYSDAKYAEVELLSPSVHLQPGQMLENHVVWQLARVEPQAPVSELLQQVRQLVATLRIEPATVYSPKVRE